MKKMIKKITLLVALMMVLSVLTGVLGACRKNEPAATTEDATTTLNETPNEEVEVDYKQYLPTGTFGGAEVGVLAMEGRDNQLFVAEGKAMDAFDNAVYKRNLYVEETYDVYFEYIKYPGAPSYAHDLLRAEFFSGSEDFEIVTGDYYWGLETCEYFYNLHDYEVLNFENPYWIDGWNQQTTINGKMYTAVGFYTMDLIRQMVGVFCNNYVAEDHGITSIYDMVDNGTWTIEAMLEMMETATADNGDGSSTFEDRYGLAYNIWGGRALLYGCGLKLASYNSDSGEVEFTLTSESNVNIFQTLYKFCNNNAFSYYGGGAGSVEDPKGDKALFQEGRALFATNPLGYSATVSGELDGFSILPTPKYDTNQADYISTILGTVVFGIMNTSKMPTRAATLLEAMTILSYEDVRPVYYEEMLKIRYQSDAKTAEIMDMMMDNIYIDFLFINSYSFGGVADAPFDFIVNYDRNYVSGMSKYEEKLQTNWEKLQAVYADKQVEETPAT